MAQTVELLPLTWDIQIEFLALGFGLTHLRLMQAVRGQLMRDFRLHFQRNDKVGKAECFYIDDIARITDVLNIPSLRVCNM